MTQGSKAGKKCAICSLLEKSKINTLLEFYLQKESESQNG